MSLEKLTALVPPPQRPKEVGPPNLWQRAEQELGVVLPGDYRAFVHTYGTYGSGLFAGFYLVHTPYEKSQYQNLVRYMEMVSEDLHSRDDVPYAIHPARPGLLLWGHDENGNYYYWLTKGEPDKWPVVTESTRGGGFELHKCSMVKYLLRVQQGKIRALAGGYPHLTMRCPVESCAGWATGSIHSDSPWGCETCGMEWEDRESFESDVAEILRKHPYRRACYVKKGGRYFPAPREQEPAGYSRLVRKEFDQ
jgi:hypothetical protein